MASRDGDSGKSSSRNAYWRSPTRLVDDFVLPHGCGELETLRSWNIGIGPGLQLSRTRTVA
jgi:hypothetical protein